MSRAIQDHISQIGENLKKLHSDLSQAQTWKDESFDKYPKRHTLDRVRVEAISAFIIQAELELASAKIALQLSEAQQLARVAHSEYLSECKRFEENFIIGG